jgi:dTDP-glucose 4,6-dehydratase
VQKGRQIVSKILVTGSEGTIGKRLVECLEARGHVVYGVDAKHTSRELYERADVGEYRQIRRAIDNFYPDVVYHLAAEFGRLNGDTYYEQNWKTNVIGTRHILEIQEEYDFRLVFASSSEVYGEFADRDYLHEGDVQAKMGAPRLTNDYAISKWVNEQQIINATERYNTDTVTLRFFNAYGPGEYYTPYRSVVALFVYRALMGLPFKVYEGYHRTFMYVDDFIPTLANAHEEGAAGVTYNIGGVDYRSVEELADLVILHTGCDPELAVRVGQETHNTTSKRPDIRRATEVLGHDPTVPLEIGVPRLIEWMRDVYDLKQLAPA